MSSRVTPELLERLRSKYRLLVDLSETREAAIGEGLTSFPTEERAPRLAVMKALAAEFPGALRELDSASSHELKSRLVELESGAIKVWMRAVALFHWALRDALAVRGGGTDQTFWSESTLIPVRMPPTGRLLDVVLTAVASELTLTPREVELLIYPRAPPRGVRQ